MDYVVILSIVLYFILTTLQRTNGFCSFGTFGVDCRFSCNCLDGCNEITGICTGPCNLGWFSGLGKTCQKQNVAYKQFTQQSSNYSSSYYLSDRAVDGNRNQRLRAGSCVHTNLYKKTAWWEVYIKPPKRIREVKMFYREVTKKRFRRFTLYLYGSDEQWHECYHHENDTIDSVVTVDCNITTDTSIIQINNRRGTPSTSGQTYEDYTYIELCEVEVYVCSNGTFGSDCSQFCFCSEGTCDYLTGQCPGNGTCEIGFTGTHCEIDCGSDKRYGVNCSESCDVRHCFSRQVCDRAEGGCVDGCQDGWIGIDCVTPCEQGFYGQNCSLSCGKCTDISLCHHVSGVCSAGCLPGWAGDTCKKDCANMSRYGVNCSRSCDDRNCDGQSDCDRVNGTCVQGCLPGWTGLDCSERCASATYGENCSLPCGQCLSGGCHHITGNCSGHCLPGFQGDLCTEKLLALPSTGLETGVIGGIAAGCLVVVLLLIALAVILVKRRKHKPKSNSAVQSRLEINMNTTEEKPAKVSNSKSNVGFDGVETVAYMNVEEDRHETYYNVDFSAVATGIDITTLANLLAETAEDDFQKEFNELPTGFTTTYEESQKPENKPKNKFQGYYPYDHNRVVLVVTGEDAKSDYINASFISNFVAEKRYIAAQAPKDSTVLDFWRMIWQEGCQTIVMLTNLVEMGKHKCSQYWPETNKEYGDIKVIKTEEIEKTFYTIRLLKSHNKKTNKERIIKHFHFTSWPDHGTPDVMNLVEFMWLVKTWDMSKTGPMLVHCSAGIGRTGSYISVDTLIEEGEKHGKVDVKRFVSQMRGERKNMIQTPEQYIFIYKALLEAFTYGNTIRNYHELQKTYTPDLTIGYKTLDQLCQAVMDEAKQFEHEERYNVYVHGTSTLCKAVQIPSQQYMSGIIVYCESVDYTNLGDETVWNIILDKQCSVVVLLVDSKENSDKALCCKKSENYQFTEFNTKKLSDDLKITKTEIKKKGESQAVCFCTLYNWSGDVPSCNMASLRTFMQSMEDSWLSNPVLVLQSKNCSQPGLFCILLNVLQGIELTGDVEVINNARRVLRHLPQTNITQEVIKHCYSVALFTEESSNIYANV